jgi:hypothetical protein
MPPVDSVSVAGSRTPREFALGRLPMEAMNRSLYLVTWTAGSKW